MHYYGLIIGAWEQGESRPVFVLHKICRIEENHEIESRKPFRQIYILAKLYPQ